MLPRHYRRRLWRRVVVALVGLALFAGAVWLALILSRPAPPGPRRVLASSKATEPEYIVGEQGPAIRLRQEVGGRDQEFEIRSTEEGLLIAPTENH